MKTNSHPGLVVTILTFIALALLLLISKSARAAGPWYVALSGSDSNSCLSAGAPCATINGAIGKASSGDTIYVETGTYTNSTGSEVVLIDKDTTLSGGWDATFTTQSDVSTINGSGARRGITVNSNVIANVEHFVIQNGSAQNSGGGIYNNGYLTVNNSSIKNNTVSGLYATGGGIFNGMNGNLTLNYSQISDNLAQEGGGNAQGGGIYNNGMLILNSVIVRGNIAQSGGGINNNFGTSTLTNTSVNGNLVSNGNGGGGILITSGIVVLNSSTVSENTNETGGGGGLTNGGTLNLINSTVSGNASPFGQGGGIYNYGIANLSNSTVTGNTSQDAGGISNIETSGTVTLKNSILASNIALGASLDCNGILTSQEYNLIQSITGCTIVGDTTGNLTGVDPLLGSFQDNGGPTLTHALLLGSPAIDTGNPATPGSGGNTCEVTDQRSIVRPQIAACDMGAFELELAIVAFSMYLPLIMR